MRCVICGRPTKGNTPYCQQDERQLRKEQEERIRRKQKNAFRYVHYRSHVVAFHQDGGDRLKPSYLGMSLSGVPRSRLLDLDARCDGFTREQVKKLKALVLRLANI